MNYYFETAQKLKLKIYDSDGDSKEKIGKVVSYHSFILKFHLMGKKKKKVT